ncbi:MAG TPA: hypothetical protein VJ904_00455 [Tichowtungia sp.]|nr:hypothetical protein [Tichowtungia sp.]
MLSLLISLIGTAAVVAACFAAGFSPVEASGAGVAAFIVLQVGIGFVVRRKIKKVQSGLQEMMENGQKQMNRKVQMFQSKPGGNIKQIQRQLESDQKKLITQALEFVDRLEPFKKWNLMIGRQIDTMRMQFLYQLKEFEEVDRILSKSGLFTGPVMLEPTAIAMKIARQYKNEGAAKAEKTFKRRIKWFRGNRGKLLYGLMSWMYVKEGEAEKAHQLLIKGADATGDETLARNLEMLANKKEKSFSNAGLGDEWYALYLENPPAPKQKRMRGNPRSGRMF